MRSRAFSCPSCRGSSFDISSTQWQCNECEKAFPCFRGIPKLYEESELQSHDGRLRDRLYDGLLGRFYSFLMPFLSMAARPIAMSLPQWCVFFMLWASFFVSISWIVSGELLRFFLGGLILGSLIWIFVRHSYIFYVLVLAIPTKITLYVRRFVPSESFQQVHERVIADLREIKGLKILDVSTGSCNSLYKHGWMELDARYTGVDLSEVMLGQGQENMSAAGVPIDLALCDAMSLPLLDEQFDVVLNYGALNGYSEPDKALLEMARVLKPGGRLLVLDEQLYPETSRIEKWYFDRVLASHDVLDACPIDLIPDSLSEVRVEQVYEFYYILTAQKTVQNVNI